MTMGSTSEPSKLSLIETISLAVGFTIGSGIITQTGIGIGMTGRSIFLAFLVSAILFLISFRPIFIMSTVRPTTSAAYVFSKELIHEDVGIFYAYVYFLGRMTIAVFGISLAQYILTYVILSTQVYSLFVGNPLWSNVIIIAYMVIVIAGIAIRRYRINHAG